MNSQNFQNLLISPWVKMFFDVPLYWTNSAGGMIGTASGLTQIGQALFHNQIINTQILTAKANILNTQTAKPITNFKKDCEKLCYGLGVETALEPGFGTVYQYEGPLSALPLFLIGLLTKI